MLHDVSAANRREFPAPRELTLHEVLEALPEAVYATDAIGRITFFNRAAAELWGIVPEIGRSEFCGSWKLYWPDGTPLPHAECPMALTLKGGKAIRGLKVVAERPDGVRVPLLPFPTPIFDADGALVGAVNMLLDLGERLGADETAERYAAVVESSDDAIVSKDLNGRITAWNRGAERLFGYTAAEAVGQPITMIIPLDQQDEDPPIMERIRRGERVEPFETIRRCKDGSLVEVSVSVSPVKDRYGRVVGAAKIARDITERRRAEERQQLLIREMSHRVKNAMMVASSLVNLSARRADSASDLARAVSARLDALAQAHALTVPGTAGANGCVEPAATLHALIRKIVAPYAEDGPPRVTVAGDDVPVAGTALTSFALLLHEFATNAAKYGALSCPEGKVAITGRLEGESFVLDWTEAGGPPADRPAGEGFGSLLARTTVEGQLGGRIVHDWKPGGLSIRLVVARDRLVAEAGKLAARPR